MQARADDAPVRPRTYNFPEPLRWLVDSGLTGLVEYALRPGVRDSWGGPFNGQLGRQMMVRELEARVGFSYAVETGTYRGTTTEFLAELIQGPVHTTEISSRHYVYARLRLRGTDGVHLHRGHSVAVMRRLIERDALPRAEPGLWYLDAHWMDALPLWEEMELVVEHFRDFVILVDDFEVPRFPNYRYDDYGRESSLTMDNVPRLVREKCKMAYPALPPEAETGSRRGCLVLSPVSGSIDLDDCCLLRNTARR